MALKSHYDIIIAGAGASGLSLLWFLLHSDSLKDKSILLADRSLTPASDKTWCFWDDEQMPFQNLIHHTWNTLEVTAFGNDYTEQLSRFKYHCMRSLDYGEAILSAALSDDRVNLLETDIEDFRYSDSGKPEMITPHGVFSAGRIFQSALRPPALDQMKMDVSLKQHFLGWEVEVTDPVFDPDKAILMDFDVPQDNGVTFVYVLPFSQTTALIEFTLFSSKLLNDEEYEAGIISYMKSKYNLSEIQYRISRTEKGVIPMEDRHYPSHYCEGVMNIGTMGGLTKPSTGYTFTRIQKQNASIVRALENGKEPPASNFSPYRFRVYDMMLLHLLDQHPDTSVKIFSELFKRNSFDRILTFLEEKTHPGQEISIFASLPYMPFFKSIWKMKHRILTGA